MATPSSSNTSYGEDQLQQQQQTALLSENLTSSMSSRDLSANSSTNNSPYYTSPTDTNSTASTSSSTTSAASYAYTAYHQTQYHHSSSLMALGGGASTGGGNMASNVTLRDEPEPKKVKLTHYQLNKQYLIGPESMLLKQTQFTGGGGILESSTNMYAVHKKLEERIGGILCCTVCLDLPQSVIYQCTNGHLMCAGCFSHLLADSRLKDEQATCPNCRCEISKNLCSRNLAVEKTLCELPASCIYCNVMYPRNCVDYHQSNECLERPIRCIYERIGCTWEGPYHELDTHSEQCIHPNRPAREILSFLKEKDREETEHYHSVAQFVDLLSLEKLCYIELQFKQYKTDDITPKIYFETSRFSAFSYYWVLKARINDNEKNPNLSLNRYISYQIILKSKLSSSQSAYDIKFCMLRGPFGEVNVTPCVHTFEFNHNRSETDYIRLNISSNDCNKLLGSKTINFRLFMFQP